MAKSNSPSLRDEGTQLKCSANCGFLFQRSTAGVLAVFFLVLIFIHSQCFFFILPLSIPRARPPHKKVPIGRFYYCCSLQLYCPSHRDNNNPIVPNGSIASTFSHNSSLLSRFESITFTTTRTGFHASIVQHFSTIDTASPLFIGQFIASAVITRSLTLSTLLLKGQLAGQRPSA